MTDVLIIGYGNESRGDDGLGPHVARAVADANLPGVRVLIVTQLLPELAAELAAVRLVVFVDATEIVSECGVKVRSLAVGDCADWCTHSANPRALLALTQAVYNRTPEAWWLTISGHRFGYGERLSETAEENSRRAVACLQGLLSPRTGLHHICPSRARSAAE